MFYVYITHGILDCRYHLKNLTSLEEIILLQWISIQYKVPSSKKADFLAKKYDFILKKIYHPMPFHSTKNLIKGFIKARAQEDLFNRVSHKSSSNAT
ncbi:hypothetical protein TNIN_257711 [Trichonephila inaurata madagascariensis]|uniref:Uncharacterized protein n=1 Tax=Trichonephila inaurata madagascariensis TaxID=2747483 RepID=A0A8X6IYH5_9ARAC|nr:hypothetical protein TNIN_257711 [Trichonephila inaurata madagascariensis]